MSIDNLVPEEATRVAMMKSGQADITTGLSPDRIVELQKAGFALQEYGLYTLASINFRQYLEKLVNRLLSSFGVSVQGIRARVAGDELHLGINQAVPAGLVASEIIVNCLKHAFPGQRQGEIHITVEVANGRRTVEIRDNGIGLGREFSLENPTTFGWLMICNLVKQLEGSVSVTSDGGTVCRLVF